MTPRFATTPGLEIAYLEHGPPAGSPAILLHGFPDDVLAYAAVAPRLAASGMRVLVPWLRGYGPTRFRDAGTPRSGQQAALGADLLAFMDALGIGQALLGGYDWGGRAACIVAALWPERVRALVSVTGYNIQNIPAAVAPASAEQEMRYWYHWYFHTERGRAGLVANRREISRLLWRLWSPNWAFTEAEFARTAESFDNPDFVEVTIQSYRHRYANAPGDPAFAAIERKLEAAPPITVPSVILHGAADGVTPMPDPGREAAHFTGPMRRHVIPSVGHFLPREAPDAMADAMAEAAAMG
ncbi:MAG: alpha/beta hydrolase [Rhodospirillales bacterium]|jgi:pimeloyl-ACP methyl ester carboxylesterase|nr:alpha/beta hydrolase [Rhodospirillales bacterium]